MVLIELQESLYKLSSISFLYKLSQDMTDRCKYKHVTRKYAYNINEGRGTKHLSVLQLQQIVAQQLNGVNVFISL